MVNWKPNELAAVLVEAALPRATAPASHILQVARGAAAFANVSVHALSPSSGRVDLSAVAEWRLLIHLSQSVTGIRSDSDHISLTPFNHAPPPPTHAPANPCALKLSPTIRLARTDLAIVDDNGRQGHALPENRISIADLTIPE
jgi:hypothetical protein